MTDRDERRPPRAPSEGRGGGPRSLVGQAKRQADAVNASICLTQRLYQVQASDDQHEDEATDDNARQYGPYPSLSKNPQEKKCTSIWWWCLLIRLLSVPCKHYKSFYTAIECRVARQPFFYLVWRLHDTEKQGGHILLLQVF